MPKKSAGILLYRNKATNLQVFLAHPGGPLWAKKDDGVWSIPKGEFEDEDPLTAARREFAEETSFQAPEGEVIPLRPVKQKSGKIVIGFAIEGDLDETKVKSNLFSLEWPPKSGRTQQFPEINRAAWFDLANARIKIRQEQAPMLDELERKLKAR